MLRIRIRWIRKILASWIRIRKNMRIHESGSKGQNINQKLPKKNLLSKPKSELFKKKIIKMSWFLNGSSSFSIKKAEKKRQIWKFCFVKKNSVNFKAITWIWIRIHFFFQCGSRIRIRIRINWILSTGVAGPTQKLYPSRLCLIYAAGSIILVFLVFGFSCFCQVTCECFVQNE